MAMNMHQDITMALCSVYRLGIQGTKWSLTAANSMGGKSPGSMRVAPEELLVPNKSSLGIGERASTFPGLVLAQQRSLKAFGSSMAQSSRVESVTRASATCAAFADMSS